MPDHRPRRAGPAATARLAAAALAALVLCALSPPPALAAEAVGEVTHFRGDGTAAGGAPERSLALGVAIHMGDTIRTDASTRVEIVFADGTRLTLGDDSSLTVDRFVYGGAMAPGEVLLSLTAGVFRAVTGEVAKLTGAPFRVRTPAATIGVRGTEFWGRQAADSLLLVLLDGTGVTVENGAGRVEIVEVGFATRVAAAADAPSAPFRMSAAALRAALDTVAW